MSKRPSNISLEQAVEFCLQSDEGHIDSSCDGLSSDEEEELDRLLLNLTDKEEENRYMPDVVACICNPAKRRLSG